MATALLAVYFSPAFAQDEIRRKGRTRIEQVPPPPPKPQEGAPQQAAGLTIDGIIRDAETKEPLSGVYIQVEGTVRGAISDDEGRFTLKREGLPVPTPLVFSYVGYAKKTILVTIDQKTIEVRLEEESVTADEVVVTASRISERIVESPVSIEKLDLRAIGELPTLTAYDAVVTLKGVDQMISSVSFKSINTRGFNSPANVRFVHRLDGLDLQAPGLNFPINALNGANDLDIASVELIPGAASALYGPNAFNGMMEVQTKSPFQYTGLSAMVRLGANHLDGIDINPRPISDLAFRYAHKFNDKLAGKINFHYNRATDWFATDYMDVANYAGTTNVERFGLGRGNPGYDGLNRYGDEVNNLFLPDFRLPGLPDVPVVLEPVLVARTGYDEKDLANYDSYNLKTDAALHYQISPKIELIWNSRYSRGTTIYQSVSRNTLTDFVHHIHKLEARGTNFFVRAYGSFEDAGDSYDTRFTGINLNNRAKAHRDWFTQYLLAYSPTLNPLLNGVLQAAGRPTLNSLNDGDARAFADGDNRALQPIMAAVLQQQLGLPAEQANLFAQGLTRGRSRYEPGTEEFNRMKDEVNRTIDRDSGAGFIDHTRFYHFEGQYSFDRHIDWAEILVGANYRHYFLASEGTIFADTGGRQLDIQEMGAYVQATKRFFDKKLRVSASGRVDKINNFDAQFSPRVALVYSPDKERKHNIRASFQTGFRMPTLQNQYINLRIGTLTYIGGLEEFWRPNGLVFEGPSGTQSNAFTEKSVTQFLQSGNPDDLRRQSIERIRPEQVQAFEIGYKSLLGQKLLFDVSYYFSRYTDFIVVDAFVGPTLANVGRELTLQDVQSRNFRVFRKVANSDQRVETHGVTVGGSYALTNKYTLTANYTFTEMLTRSLNEGVDFIVGFNTPLHKTNVGITGRDVWKKLGFGITHRWVDAMNFEETIFSGPLPAYNLIDAQISYTLSAYKTQLRLGGTNILNNRHLEARVGPTVGAIVYLEIRYDSLFR
jgi:outer membrane receptor protein involved in Fe transport